MFKVTQKVVCVDNSFGQIACNLIKDEIYTIREICGPYHDGNYGFFLHEVKTVNYNGEWTYCSSRFRPVDYTFGEKLAEEIQEEINQENLVNA